MYIQYNSLSWFGTDTSIKCDGVTLVLEYGLGLVKTLIILLIYNQLHWYAFFYIVIYMAMYAI